MNLVEQQQTLLNQILYNLVTKRAYSCSEEKRTVSSTVDMLADFMYKIWYEMSIAHNAQADMNYKQQK